MGKNIISMVYKDLALDPVIMVETTENILV